MADSSKWNRRSVIKATGIGAMAAFTQPVAWVRGAEETKPNGHIKQSVCAWCYKGIPLEKLAEESKRMGFKSVELLKPADFEKVKHLGITCAMVSGACEIPDGFNDKKNHDRLEKSVREHIEYAAENNLPSVIVFSGNRRGMPDDVGLANCVQGLKRVVGLAEKKNVTICMELLNSKVNHKDYMCDRSPWGCELVKQVDSPRFKLLYDIYHMQIMEGDIIRTIRDNFQWLAHFHTAGNPGRNEISIEQELNYKGIAKAIADLGYKGYICHEYTPKVKPWKEALLEAVASCTV